MSRKFSDEMIDAQLLTYLRDRAEDGAARARTPEQVAARMSAARRPRFWGARLEMRAASVAWVVALALLVLALLASLFGGARLPSPIPTRTVRIGIELPLGGDDRVAVPIANGIKLAVDDASGQTDHFRIEIPQSVILSDLVNGLADGPRGAANMRQIVADPDVIAVIGPFNSTVAHEQIPISNAAGLLQCSPATTEPQLTRPGGSGTLRSGSPTSSPANYIRVVTTDDVAAAGAARYLLERLGKTSVYVLDDKSDYGIAVANWFEAELTRLGGSVVARQSLTDAEAAQPGVLDAARAKNPQAIYFGGAANEGAVLLKAAGQAGLGEIPFVGTEALNDGNAVSPGSFLSLVGDGAKQGYSVFPGLADGPGKTAFDVRYRAAYEADPTPFASLGYACGQVVIAALQRVDANLPPGTTILRDAVRAAGVDTNTTFETILGPIAFDARGDITQQRVAIYTFDAAASNWVYADQIDAAPGFGR